jgi:hypothetical protein
VVGVAQVNLRTASYQKCVAVPRRDRIQGSKIVVSLNSRLESDEKQEEEVIQSSVAVSY